jgi:hypothetical protein
MVMELVSRKGSEEGLEQGVFTRFHHRNKTDAPKRDLAKKIQQ